MSLLLWTLRILVLLLILRFLLRLFTARPAPADRRPRGTRRQERLGGTLVRDPHCGTYVPASSAITVGRGNAVHHFCSAGCRDAWAAAHRT